MSLHSSRPVATQAPVLRALVLTVMALLGGRAPCQEWQLLSPANAPGPLVGFAALLEARCVAVPGGPIVLFGGMSAFPHQFSDRTMTFDGNDWGLEQVTAPASLVGRRRAYMAWCAATNSIVLFGGLTASGSPASRETFHYDHATRTWTEMEAGLQPGVTSPTHTWSYGWCRTATGMLLFGGPHGAAQSETWHWDGAQWTLVATPTMPLRIDPLLAYDENRGVVVMFGGAPSALTANDATWEFDGTTWYQVFPAHRPSARTGSVHGGMAFDAPRGRMVLCGGTEPGFVLVQDVWEYDGLDWTEVVPTAAAPSGRYHAVVYDDTSEKVFAFASALGQTNDETWLFEGSHARFETYGNGCAGSAGIPVLTATASTNSAFGVRFEFRVTGTTLGVALLVAAPTATAGTPLWPIGFPFLCFAYPTSVEATAVLSGAPPTYTMTVPWQPSLVGAEFFVQALCFDTTATPLPLVVTNGGRGVIF